MRHVEQITHIHFIVVYFHNVSAIYNINRNRHSQLLFFTQMGCLTNNNTSLHTKTLIHIVP